jgi:hypothetical protein
VPDTGEYDPYDPYGYPSQQQHQQQQYAYEGYDGYGGHVPFGGHQDQFDQHDPYYERPVQPGQYYPDQQQHQQFQQTYGVDGSPSMTYPQPPQGAATAVGSVSMVGGGSSSPRTPQPQPMAAGMDAVASGDAPLNHHPDTSTTTAGIAEKGDYAVVQSSARNPQVLAGDSST